MDSICAITGATGFLGSHLAEACAARGLGVRALVRPGSDTALLEKNQATLIRGDLADPASVRTFLEGADVVLHCAAKVGDWGPVEDYRAVNVDALRELLEVCRGRNLRRFVHFSSLGVYAARHHYGTDETAPLPERHVDGYTQTKVEGEHVALEYQQKYGVPVVILRPGFIYGPRDRSVMPKLLDNLRKRMVRYITKNRTRVMNTIYVGNLVDATFLAIDNPNAVGQVYNLTDGERVTKRRFIETIVKEAGLRKPPPVPVPLWMARVIGWWQEGLARRRHATIPPRVTQARIKFLGLNLDFSIDKARRELGYQPRIGFDEGMKQTLAWYRQNS
jgi:nucleoside-diphosphate-sugar epimerase